MKHSKKGLALFMAILLSMPTLPANADESIGKENIAIVEETQELETEELSEFETNQSEAETVIKENLEEETTTEKASTEETTSEETSEETTAEKISTEETTQEVTTEETVIEETATENVSEEETTTQETSTEEITTEEVVVENEAASIQEFKNGDFETGDLTGWTLLDGAPATNDNNDVGKITNDEKYWETSGWDKYFYKQGNYFLRGDVKEGISGGAIRSGMFELSGDGYISFMLGAASAESKGSVKVYDEEDTCVKTYTNAHWSDPATGNTLIRIYDQLSDYIGQKLYFVIENGTDTAGFAFINADDFKVSLTKEEVEKLQQETLTMAKDMNDTHSADILDAYKANIIIEDFALVEEIAEEVKMYDGLKVDIKQYIVDNTKVEGVISGKKADIEVNVLSVTKDDKELKADYSSLMLREGKYVIKYSITYNGKAQEKEFTIVVDEIDKSANDVINGGFETGDLTGWTPLGENVWSESDGVYKGVISAETYWGEKLPYNQEGNYHLDGWTVTGNEAASWGLKSSVFTLDGSGWISVRMGGKAARFKVYKWDGTLIGTFNQNRFSDTNFPFVGQGGSWADMGTYFVDLSEYKGEQLYIELWDRTLGGGWTVAFFDDVKCYYEQEPDVENGYDEVRAPISRNDEGLIYDNIKIPWTRLMPPKKDILKLSFEDSGFEVKNSEGNKGTANIESVFKNPVYQDKPVEPYRPNGVRGNALDFDGYSNSAVFNETVEGSKLTVDVYVCPRVYTWSGPNDPRENHVAEVFAGSYNTGSRAGFLLGVTKHGYPAFRVGTGSNWYKLVGTKESCLPTYEWSRVTAVFDGDEGKMSLYVNGKEAASMEVERGSEIVSAANEIIVGRGSESVIEAEQFDKTMFCGLMDELSISLTAKTADEIASNGYELPEISYEDAMTPDSALAGDWYRPQYHAVPSGNWMNEPHALFQYKDKWHLFYQFNPAGPYWHNISWGHWVSDDMVSWEFVKEAVIPTQDTVTPDGVWTGNVIFTSDGYPLLLITAGDDSRPVNGSNQHVGLVRAADYDDPELTEWEIIGYALAQDESMGKPGEFRDAQAFGIGSDRYMVVGGSNKEWTQGIAHVYKTTAQTLDKWEEDCSYGELNGMNWEYKGSILGDYWNSHNYKSEYGKVWELPNLVPLRYEDGSESGKYLLVFSPQHGDFEAFYYIGDFDTDTCRFTPDFEEAKLMDYGDNIFTGPTVYLDNNDNKVYICSILQDGGRTFLEHKNAGWAFCAGLPRELFLHKDGTLGIKNINTSPIEGNQIVSFNDLSVQEANEKLKAVDSDRIKIDFEFKGSASEIGFNLKKSENNETTLYLTDSELGLDSKKGAYQKQDIVKGTIYVDKSYIEVYVDNKITISGVKYIRGTGLEIFAKGDAVCSVTVTEMNSIHEDRVICNHEETEIVKKQEPTCAVTGYTGDTVCKKCKKVISTGSEIAKIPHDYIEAITKRPTQANPGEKTFTCKNCGYGYTEVTDELGENINGFYVECAEQVTYTAAAVKLEPVVYDSNSYEPLKKGVDYTLSYKNNKNTYTLYEGQDGFNGKKAPQIIIKGKGNYKQDMVVYFTIQPKNINDSDVTSDNFVLENNGKVQTKKPVIKFKNKKLKENKDFEYTYPELENLKTKDKAFKENGTYKIVVKGKGDYTGTRTVKLTITAKGTNISKAVIQKIQDKTYSAGKGIELTEDELKVSIGNGKNKKVLVPNKDYRVTYENNTDIGTATVIITGMGRYAGSKKATFKIVGKSVSGAVITGISGKVYNGMAQEQQDITVTKSGVKLVKNRDYVLKYDKNINVGTAKVTICGVKKYSGKITKTFKITPYNFDGETDSLLTEKNGLLEKKNGELSVKYVKGGAKPQVNLEFNGKKLAVNKDYTVTYTNNKALTTPEKMATVTIKGKGNFKGTITKKFNIISKELKNTESPVSMTVADIPVSKKSGRYISRPVLTDADGKVLKVGRDYTKAAYYLIDENGKETALAANSKVEAGKQIKATVTGLGAYKGEISAVYRITKNNFKTAKVKIISKEYTGKAVTLDAKDFFEEDGKTSIVTINNGTRLVYGTDFEIVEVSYKNNIKKGTASVTLKGLGEYGGSKTIKFKINSKGLFWWWQL